MKKRSLHALNLSLVQEPIADVGTELGLRHPLHTRSERQAWAAAHRANSAASVSNDLGWTHLITV